MQKKTKIEVRVDDSGEIFVDKDDLPYRDFRDVRSFIVWLFFGRCVGLSDPCHKSAIELSHIIPRSRGDSSSHWKNLVLHCREHHREYHDKGTSDEAIEALQERRKEYLTTSRREQFI